jgi:hypothetical protein
MTFMDGVTWAALIVAAFAGIFTALQWKSAERSADAAEASAEAAKDSARTSRTAFEVGQRAWVVHDSTVRTIHPPDQQNVIVVSAVSNFKNCGPSPAFKVLTGQWLETMYTFQAEYKNWDTLGGSEIVLGPAMFGNLPNSIGVPVSGMQDIQSGGIKLYLFGRITYMDIFDQSHETLWCLEYRPETNSFAYTRFHNSAT